MPNLVNATGKILILPISLYRFIRLIEIFVAVFRLFPNINFNENLIQYADDKYPPTYLSNITFNLIIYNCMLNILIKVCTIVHTVRVRVTDKPQCII